jgi:NitT/TauT family transport system permease protein
MATTEATGTTSAATAAATRSDTRRRANPWRQLARASWWKVLIVFAALIGLWYGIAKHYDNIGLTWVVPYPHQVLQVLGDSTSRHDLLIALWHSSEVALTGLAIAILIGVVWAVLMAQATWAEQSLYPYAVILQCIPILALVPLIGSMQGYGFKARVIVTVMISIFPMVSNTLFGLQSTDRGQRELFQLQGASRFTLLCKLQVPAALPSIFIGLRTAAGLSVIGSIVGDQFFQRGTPGLGVLIQVDNSRLMGPETFAAILTASLLGVVVFLLFGLLGKLAIGRWYSFR